MTSYPNRCCAAVCNFIILFQIPSAPMWWRNIMVSKNQIVFISLTQWWDIFSVCFFGWQICLDMHQQRHYKMLGPKVPRPHTRLLMLNITPLVSKQFSFNFDLFLAPKHLRHVIIPVYRGPYYFSMPSFRCQIMSVCPSARPFHSWQLYGIITKNSRQSKILSFWPNRRPRPPDFNCGPGINSIGNGPDKQRLKSWARALIAKIQKKKKEDK